VGEWYSDKDIFEMIQGLKADLSETRITIKRYNGLWEKFEGMDMRLNNIEQRKIGRISANKSFREWGGWLFGGCSIVIAGIALFHK